MLKKLFGTKEFYKHVMLLTLPIMLQNGITNFVNMLDNVMVGQMNNAAMTGVSVSNQLIFVFNLCVFGAISGAGIFGAQYFGSGNPEGVRHTLRFKILFCGALTLLGITVFLLGGDTLIRLYLKGEASVEDIEATFGYAKEYLLVMLLGLLPYTMAQSYASTLREGGQTLLPMYAGTAAVLINLVLNYVLIFGHFGAPALGVTGAAIATVISRFAELAIVMLWTHRHPAEAPFAQGLYRSLHVPKALIRNIAVKGLPLMANEALWATGIAFLNQRYSLRGLEVVTALNISQTFFNVFSVAFMSVGVAVGIIVGQQLGAGDNQGAKDSARQLITFSVLVSLAVGAAYAVFAQWIPEIYNTTDTVRHLATRLMQITALMMPLDAFAHATYFTLRSGGRTFITILFDSCFVWVVSVTAATLLIQYTELPILPLYLICQLLNIIKCVLGFVFVKKGIWIRNIIQTET